MADWYGSARSNYFKVKDREKFVEFLEEYGLELIEKEVETIDAVCTACLQKNDVPPSCEHIVRRSVGECTGKVRKENVVGFVPSGEDNGGLPQYREDDQGHVKEFDDFVLDLVTHVEEGWVAIMQEIGSEKLRYLTGFSLAINSKGEKRSINIDDIYEQAEELGSSIIPCKY